MDLLFEVINPSQLRQGEPRSGAFGPDGGIVGRHPACFWCIEDRHLHLSKRHAQVRCHGGEFFLTDLSRNGIEHVGSGALPKGREIRVRDGDRFRLGDLEIQARLRSWTATEVSGQGAVRLFPDSAPRGLTPDLLTLTEGHDKDYSVIDELTTFLGDHGLGDHRLGDQGATKGSVDHGPADRDHLVIPRLVPEPDPRPAPAGPFRAAEMSGPFWQRVGQLLGIDLTALETASREALLLDALGLLRQCIVGLQRNLRNRDDLEQDLCRGALRTAATRVSSPGPQADADDMLRELLRPEPGQDASKTISQAFGSLQVHQVATQAASRAVARAALQQFSPQQLNWEFERDSSRPVINTAGSRWRAYLRFHHPLSRNDDWSETLLARHFAQAYQDQIRLTTTLHLDVQG